MSDLPNILRDRVYPTVSGLQDCVSVLNAADRIEALESTLKDIEDYLAGIADCDMDQDGHVPNDEMRLLVQVRAALYGEDKP